MTMSTEDEEDLERLILAYSPRLRNILEAARQRIQAGAGIGHEDFLARRGRRRQRKVIKERIRKALAP